MTMKETVFFFLFDCNLFIYTYSVDAWLENWLSLVQSRHFGGLHGCVRPAKWTPVSLISRPVFITQIDYGHCSDLKVCSYAFSFNWICLHFRIGTSYIHFGVQFIIIPLLTLNPLPDNKL